MMENEKISVSDVQLKSELIALFESGKTAITELQGVIKTKYKIGNDRYFKIANETLNEWANLKDKAINEQILTNASESLKSGLKSKLERLLELQEQIKKLNDELEANVMIVSTFSDGELITGMRPLNAIEKATVNKTIKEIRAEISKIEGDYAPNKTAHTDVSGNDAKIKVIGIEYID
jgi:hypothetical protein